MRTVLLIELILSTLGALVFLISYSIKARWWKSLVGWMLISFPVLLILVFLHRIAFNITRGYPGAQIIGVVIYGFTTIAVWLFVFVGWWVNRKGKKDELGT